MTWIDTHCHLHDSEFFSPVAAELAYKIALEEKVELMIGAASNLQDSLKCIEFASGHDNYYAMVGIHPHDATTDKKTLQSLDELLPNRQVVAIGECGLDFYYNDRSECLEKQETTLRHQIELALMHDLPISFHVREGFVDFWRILDDYQGVKGVLHSFTDKQEHLDEALHRGLYIGINGIATFTTHSWQRQLFKTVPLESVLIETDAPFLTPKPFRGKLNSPHCVIYITSHLAELRGEDEQRIVDITTRNARRLFTGKS